VTTFLEACLYVFAGCAALGLIPAAVIAAKVRYLGGFVMALLIAAFVMFILIASAVKL
jgi:hypothetical protein